MEAVIIVILGIIIFYVSRKISPTLQKALMCLICLACLINVGYWTFVMIRSLAAGDSSALIGALTLLFLAAAAALLMGRITYGLFYHLKKKIRWRFVLGMDIFFILFGVGVAIMTFIDKRQVLGGIEYWGMYVFSLVCIALAGSNLYFEFQKLKVVRRRRRRK